MDLLFQKLFGVLSMCKNEMVATDYNSYLYDLTEAHLSGIDEMQTTTYNRTTCGQLWKMLSKENADNIYFSNI